MELLYDLHFRMWLQFEGSLLSLSLLGFSEKDIDEVKGIFSDSNTYLLLVTFLVAALHVSYCSATFVGLMMNYPS